MFSGSEPGNAFVRNQSFSADKHKIAQQSSNDFLNAFRLRQLERNLRISATSERLGSILRAEILSGALSRVARRRRAGGARGLRARSPGILAFLCGVRTLTCIPVCRQTLPKGDSPVGSAGEHPAVRRPLGLGAHTHIGIETETQQEAAQQGGVVLAVSLSSARFAEILEGARQHS